MASKMGTGARERPFAGPRSGYLRRVLADTIFLGWLCHLVLFWSPVLQGVLKSTLEAPCIHGAMA